MIDQDQQNDHDYDELLKAMTDPRLQTPNTDHNLDKKYCSHRTMFKENQREIFIKILKDSCFLKRNCEIDI